MLLDEYLMKYPAKADALATSKKISFPVLSNDEMTKDNFSKK
jgi:hypothetical protein